MSSPDSLRMTISFFKETRARFSSVFPNKNLLFITKLALEDPSPSTKTIRLCDLV